MRTLLTQMFCLMCNTQLLWLNNNQIGDAGIEALAKAAGGGAMPQLRELRLNNNKIGDAGVEALAKAAATGALASVSTLNLGGNRIGNDGMQALLKILPGKVYV